MTSAAMSDMNPAASAADVAEDAAPAEDWTPDQAHPQPQRERFCLAFVDTPNATRAAAFAGYSLKTARQQGSRLLKDPYVMLRIEELRLSRGIVYDLPRDTLLDRAEMLFWHAVENNRLGVALAAMAFQSKLAGHTMPGRFPPRPSVETLHLIAKMSSVYVARRLGRPLAPDEEQFARGYAPRVPRRAGRVDDPFEDIHRHYTEATDAGAGEKSR